MGTDQTAVQSSINYWMQRTFKEKGSIMAAGQVALGTTKGSVREDNQDRAAVLTFFPNEHLSEAVQVAVLCDGIGGLKDGGNASVLAISSFVAELVDLSDDNLKGRLRSAAKVANDEVYNKYRGKGGCTLSAVSTNRKGVVEIVNYGDSRVYLQSGEELTQLSTDDTLDGQLAKMDRQVDVSLPEFKHLVQFIGMEGELDTSPIDTKDIKSGDRLILASDGAYDVEFSTMEKILVNSSSTEDGIKKLLLLSDWIGGKDNATVVCMPAFSSVEGYKSMTMPTFEICTWSASYIFSVSEFRRELSTVSSVAKSTSATVEEAERDQDAQKAKKKKAPKKKKVKEPSENHKEKKDKNDEEAVQLKIEFGEDELG